MVRDNKIPYEQVNLIIQEVYDYYQLQGNPRVMLIDTHASIGENQIHDGIHLNENGQALWYEALVRFARENQLPQ
jgi:lysophospholipase L1-like esterase